FTPNSLGKSLRGNTTYYGIKTQVQTIDKNDIATAISFDAALSKINTTPATADYNNTAGNVDFYFSREIPADMVNLFNPGEKIRRVFLSRPLAFNAMLWVIKLSPSVALTTPGFEDAGAWTGADLLEAYDGRGTKPLNETDKAIIDRYLGQYKSGVSYYRLNIYETTDGGNKRHLVRRNHKYNATVTSFTTLGVPNPGDLDKNPEKPVDADITHVTALIKVAEWHDVDMSEDL
ncbi:MAG: fimbria major subunit, partial [Rikenellaceae bacterium]